MRRLALAGIVVGVVLAGAVGLTLSAGADDRRLAFSNGVNAFHAASLVGRGYTACERDVHVEAGFDAIQLALVNPPPRVNLGATVSRSSGGAPIASGVVPPGPGGRSRRITVEVVHLSNGVPAGGSVDVCFASKGGSRLSAIMGSPDVGGGPSYGVLVGPRGGQQKLGTDFHLVFLRAHPRSALSQVPAMFRRAALFRPSFIGAWTYWALLAIVLLAVPALLVRALWAADRDAPDGLAGVEDLGRGSVCRPDEPRGQRGDSG